MILDTTTKSIEITMGEAKTTVDMDIVSSWADIDTATTTYADGATDTTSNGVSVVTLVAAPAASTVRRIKTINIWNTDSVQHNVTIKYNDNGTKRVLWTGVMLVNAQLTYTNGTWSLVAAQTFQSAIEYVIDGTGSTIVTGYKGSLEMPFSGTIIAVTLLADQTWAIVVDIWKSTYAQFDAGATHPVAADKITASTPPTITATGSKSQDTTLTGWTTSFSKGDILGFNVNSVTSIVRCTISLKVNRS